MDPTSTLVSGQRWQHRSTVKPLMKQSLAKELEERVVEEQGVLLHPEVAGLLLPVVEPVIHREEFFLGQVPTSNQVRYKWVAG